jgi:HAD superfamily hydrolase (TIGR01484 family)
MILEERPPYPFFDSGRPPVGLILTDLDGTFRPKSGRFHPDDLAALERAGRRGWVRVVATGRSLYSYEKAAPRDLPLDFILFSSGAGIIRTADWSLIRWAGLDGDETRRAAEALFNAGLDFMIHDPVPDNHHYRYYRQTTDNPDFERRISIYRDVTRAGRWEETDIGPAAQLVAVAPPDRDPQTTHAQIQQCLEGLTVIRTTSPLDGRSLWIEIFPGTISKAGSARWLGEQLGLGGERAAAVGNDYNDLDLLDWAGRAFVVGDAPAELIERFEPVASSDQAGLAEAIRRAMG